MILIVFSWGFFSVRFIYYSTGINEIRLDSKRNVVADHLRAVDKTTTDLHESGNRSQIWIYRLLRLESSFDSEHAFRSSRVSSYHPYTLVQAVNPMGLNEKFLLQKFPHLELDIEISADKEYFTERALDLTYGTAHGKVISVTVFPQHDETSGRGLWPR